MMSSTQFKPQTTNENPCPLLPWKFGRGTGPLSGNPYPFTDQNM